MEVYQEIKKNIKKSLTRICDARHNRVKKPDNSYVSEGDLLVDKIVRKTILGVHPDSLLISEETHQNIAVNSEDFPESIFVIDPIDGTENFVSGLPEWGISISRYSKVGRHIESMLWCPKLDMYLDTKMKFKSGQSRSRIAAISSSMRLEDLQKTTPGYEYRMFGCCVCSMQHVILGNFLSFENPQRANSWDILAGVNLALAAGLSVKVNSYDYRGEYLPHTEKYSFRIDNEKLLS